MRRPFLAFLLMLVVPLIGCSDSTGPEAFSISGRWRSVEFSGAEFTLTIVETARAVEGAGHVVVGAEASACHIFGANSGRVASLLLDFDDRGDITFEGTFVRGEETTQLIGELFGGGYSGEEITFSREEE